MLNEALNVVAALDYEQVGEVVMFKELLADGDASWSSPAPTRSASSASPSRCAPDTIRAGDSLLLDTRSGYVYEKVPKSEVEELVLEEVPDIAYESIGGLAARSRRSRTPSSCPTCTPSCSRSTSCGRPRACCSTARPAAARR